MYKVKYAMMEMFHLLINAKEIVLVQFLAGHVVEEASLLQEYVSVSVETT